MSSIQDNLIAVGLAQTLAICGDEIVYHRGVQSLTFQAIAGQHTEQAVDGETIVAEVVRHDFLFPVASLLRLDPAQPGKADWIESGGKHWEVTEQPGIGWWKYMDPARTWCRVRVTEVGDR